MVFHRDFREFSGGHLKVWNYFGHVAASPDHEPWIRFSPGSRWDGPNPWRAVPDRVLGPDAGVEADVLFLAGLDWLRLAPRARRRPPCPVVNLIQHVRHAAPDDPRFAFLRHPAVRICVSDEVAEAIVSTGRVNGPVFTIPNAVDVPAAAAPGTTRDLDVLVVASKGPETGALVAGAVGRRGRSVRLVDRWVPRDELLDGLRRARVTVFVPHRTEGFYLPALEGMALGTVVVCPDCVGNRSFCLPDLNCLRPAFDAEALAAAAETALAWPADRVRSVVENAAATASRHDLATERSAFLEILRDVDRLHPR